MAGLVYILERKLCPALWLCRLVLLPDVARVLVKGWRIATAEWDVCSNDRLCNLVKLH